MLTSISYLNNRWLIKTSIIVKSKIRMIFDEFFVFVFFFDSFIFHRVQFLTKCVNLNILLTS